MYYQYTMIEFFLTITVEGYCVHVCVCVAQMDSRLHHGTCNWLAVKWGNVFRRKCTFSIKPYITLSACDVYPTPLAPLKSM